MTLTFVRSGTRGLERFGSLYLVSALLVLAGGYATLYTGGQPVSVALDRVLGTQLAYEVALLLVLAYLARARRETRDPLLLAGILSTFLLDALLVQHLYGWRTPDGIFAARTGGAASLLLLLVMALALRVPVASRPVGCMAATILFARLAPFVLEGAVGTDMAPRHVALGWLLAACLLPALVLPPLRDHAGFPGRAVDVAATAGSLAFAVAHFLPAGTSFDLPLRVGYFAPFVILLAPVIERLAPRVHDVPSLERLTSALPWLGLALSATQFPPGMLDAPWAQSWPLTPFTLALALTVVVQGVRAWRLRDMTLAHATVALAAAGSLGGDLPEILSRARYPLPWQPLVVGVIAWSFVAPTRRLLGGSALHALVAFVSAGALAALGMPWGAAWVALLAWGPLVLARGAREIPPRLRMALAAGATGLPVALLLLEHASLSRAIFAAASCAAGALLAAATRDRAIGRAVVGSSIAGVVGWPVSLQVYGEIGAGLLLVELGFVVLLAGFLNSLMGDRIRAALGRIGGA